MTLGTVIALIGLGLTIAVQLVTVGIFVGKINAFSEMTAFRFSLLEKKQDKYNNMQERLAVVENSDKSAHHRIDTLMRRSSAGGTSGL